MIELVSLKPEHLEQINEPEYMAYLRPYFTRERVEMLAAGPMAKTLLIDGRPVVAGGVLEYWPGRGEAWAIFDRDCKKEFITILNCVKRFLTLCPLKRIEAVVDFEFEAGHRFIKALGFEVEAPRLKKYRPNGGDSVLYARVVN